MPTDFYNQNLHPITMFGKETEKRIDSYKGRTNIGKEEFNPEIHVYSSEAIKITGLRAKILKKKIESFGFDVFVYYSKTVYTLESINFIMK